MNRLPINKTPKCYVGGAFIRSESGSVSPLHDTQGTFIANIPQCSRKDLRNAVEAAAKAGAGWAKRSGYNRGQILYRMAEMVEARCAELENAVMIGGTPSALAKLEVRVAIDRIVHYAGWADKYEQLLGSVNPVSSPHFNFTSAEPVGVIGVIAPDLSPLLALIALIIPVITAGNSAVALASGTNPYPALLLGEMLATSDLPGGVVNLLTGRLEDLIPTFATHAHLRGILASVSAPHREALRLGAADSVKRVRLIPTEDRPDWFSTESQSLYEMAHFVEYKTTWHPVGC